MSPLSIHLVELSASDLGAGDVDPATNHHSQDQTVCEYRELDSSEDGNSDLYYTQNLFQDIFHHYLSIYNYIIFCI